jgi:hypothetical protein
VTCHRFGLWRSHFLSASRTESGFAAKESGDQSPQSISFTHHRVQYATFLKAFGGVFSKDLPFLGDHLLDLVE